MVDLNDTEAVLRASKASSKASKKSRKDRGSTKSAKSAASLGEASVVASSVAPTEALSVAD